jgi:hypothetical protein
MALIELAPDDDVSELCTFPSSHGAGVNRITDDDEPEAPLGSTNASDANLDSATCRSPDIFPKRGGTLSTSVHELLSPRNFEEQPDGVVVSDSDSDSEDGISFTPQRPIPRVPSVDATTNPDTHVAFGTGNPIASTDAVDLVNTSIDSIVAADVDTGVFINSVPPSSSLLDDANDPEG